MVFTEPTAKQLVLNHLILAKQKKENTTLADETWDTLWTMFSLSESGEILNLIDTAEKMCLRG